MIHLMKYITGPWEQCKNYLRLDLDSLQTAINQLENELTAGTGTVRADAIQGDATFIPRYVANTGADRAPKWDRVDLASSGVKNRLPFSNVQAASTDSILLGRGDSGPGDFQEIDLGPNLSITGTTLNATGSGISFAQVAARVSLGC